MKSGEMRNDGVSLNICTSLGVLTRYYECMPSACRTRRDDEGSENMKEKLFTTTFSIL